MPNSFAVRSLQGFDVYWLGNGFVELAVVPELGAKIISLKDLRTGREWLSHPAGELKLFRNHPGDDFSRSPLAGVDECLPTIAPCRWQGRELPDHGEVWSAAWKTDPELWTDGILKTSVRLNSSPFAFERTIQLRENEISLGYRLNNLGALEESFVWALHPLLKLQPHDCLEIPGQTRSLLSGAAWADDLDSIVVDNHCVKHFAAPVTQGWAAIKNKTTGDRLQFEWSAAENNALGLWSTRGGWHGHHHFALEPGNSDHDALAVAAGRDRCGKVPAAGFVTWQICLRIGS